MRDWLKQHYLSIGRIALLIGVCLFCVSYSGHLARQPTFEITADGIHIYAKQIPQGVCIFLAILFTAIGSSLSIFSHYRSWKARKEIEKTFRKR
jgi:nucleoside recognition membrane protein YjiH